MSALPPPDPTPDTGGAADLAAAVPGPGAPQAPASERFLATAAANTDALGASTANDSAAHLSPADPAGSVGGGVATAEADFATANGSTLGSPTSSGQIKTSGSLSSPSPSPPPSPPTPPPSPPPPPPPADMSSDDWKKQGNTAFQAHDYDDAIIYYSNGIDLEPTNPALFSNRSAAYLKTGDTAKARRDADMCIELDKHWPKGWWRRGQAQLEAQEYADARDTFREGLTYCPSDDNLTRGLENAEKRVAVLEAVQGKQAEPAFDPDAPSARDPASASDAAFAATAGGASGVSGDDSVFPGSPETEIRRIKAAPNHYATLHVSPEASAGQMKKNYHILARMLHPDKCQHPDASEAMGQVSLAYDTLTNVMKKTLYDQFMSQAAEGDKKQTYAEWEAKQQPVEIPKWLSWILAIKGCGWILAIVLLIIFLPIIIILAVFFVILWCICCPYRTALRYCFPEKYAQMKERQEREQAKAEELAQDRQFP
jgi:tetratricopeptide (TPR) repeat protein